MPLRKFLWTGNCIIGPKSSGLLNQRHFLARIWGKRKLNHQPPGLCRRLPHWLWATVASKLQYQRIYTSKVISATIFFVKAVINKEENVLKVMITCVVGVRNVRRMLDSNSTLEIFFMLVLHKYAVSFQQKMTILFFFLYSCKLPPSVVHFL